MADDDDPRIAYPSIAECDKELVNCSRLLRTSSVTSRPLVIAHADDVLDRRLDLCDNSRFGAAA